MKQSKEEIHNICERYNIDNYTINDDGSIDVDDDIELSSFDLSNLPLKFNKVNGNFYCNRNHLTSLTGCPRIVVGDFWIDFNKLTSLIGCPDYVGGDFDCNDNKLLSLDGCTKEVGGDFNCSENHLTSLVNLPNALGYIDFGSNKLHHFYHTAYGSLGNDLSIFTKYMDHYEVFEPVFNEENGLELINEIKDGLR